MLRQPRPAISGIPPGTARRGGELDPSGISTNFAGPALGCISIREFLGELGRVLGNNFSNSLTDSRGNPRTFWGRSEASCHYQGIWQRPERAQVLAFGVTWEVLPAIF